MNEESNASIDCGEAIQSNVTIAETAGKIPLIFKMWLIIITRPTEVERHIMAMGERNMLAASRTGSITAKAPYTMKTATLSTRASGRMVIMRHNQKQWSINK